MTGVEACMQRYGYIFIFHYTFGISNMTITASIFLSRAQAQSWESTLDDNRQHQHHSNAPKIYCVCIVCKLFQLALTCYVCVCMCMYVRVFVCVGVCMYLCVCVIHRCVCRRIQYLKKHNYSYSESDADANNACITV